MEGNAGKVEILNMESAPPEREGPLTDAIDRLRSDEGQDDQFELPPDDTETPVDEADEEPGEQDELEGEAEDDSDEADDTELEGEAEEGEGTEEYVEVELPDALREQGVDTIEVPKGQEELFRALTNGYTRTQEVEAAKKEAQELADGLEADWSKAAGFMIGAPFQFLTDYAKADPNDILDEIKLYLIEHGDQMDALLDWHGDVAADQREATHQTRELKRNRQQRVEALQQQERQKFEYKTRAMKIDREIERLVEDVAPALRPRLLRLARQEMHNEAQRRATAGESALIEPSDVAQLIEWLVEPHRTDGSRPKKGDETPTERAEKASQRFNTRLARSKQARNRPRQATGPIIRGAPKRGILLNDLLDQMKGGTG